MVRRVTDDGVRVGPRDSQGIVVDDARQIDEGQRGLVEGQLLDGEAVSHPQRDAGERDREGVDLDATDVLQREEDVQPRSVRQTGRNSKFRLSFMQAPLDPPQLSIGEVEEVARAARRVEHHVAHEVGLRALGLAVGREVLDALAPRPHDGRKDDLLQLGVVGVVSSELPLLIVSKRALQERPEDLWLDLTPVERGSFAQ